MRWLKRLGQSDAVLSLAAGLIAAYTRLVFRTGRWQVEAAPEAAPYLHDGATFIGAFWHGRLLILPCFWPVERPAQLLISRHRDGEVIARVLDRFGLATVRGSTAKGRNEKGGGAALRAMVRGLKGGICVGITPDGPRGPRMRASEGIVALARLTEVPIIPLTYSAQPAITWQSWDRFLLPLPFARGRIVWGAPVHVAPDADAEALAGARRRLENALNDLTADADRALGRDPVPPAALEPDARA